MDLERKKMRFNGKNYKAISFTVMKEKLLSKEKRQTMRMLFIPTYSEGEIVAIVFKDKKKEKEFLYFVIVKKIYPKILRDITLAEAKLDGFDSIKECQECLIDLNKKKLDNWLFITRWEPLKVLA